MANRKHYTITLDDNYLIRKTRVWDYFRLRRMDFITLRDRNDQEVRTVGIENYLTNNGWRKIEYETEVLTIAPDLNGNFDYAHVNGALAAV